MAAFGLVEGWVAEHEIVNFGGHVAEEVFGAGGERKLVGGGVGLGGGGEVGIDIHPVEAGAGIVVQEGEGRGTDAATGIQTVFAGRLGEAGGEVEGILRRARIAGRAGEGEGAMEQREGRHRPHRK